MIILGIETSCDETAAAVVSTSKKEEGFVVLSSVVATSMDLHAATGGIIPENAARRQVESIIPVIQKALTDAFPKLTTIESQYKKIDAIAVTFGPGLIGSLLVGVETAKTLSLLWNKPLIPVNHLVAHIYSNWINDKEDQLPNGSKTKGTPLNQYSNCVPEFPALALVVSGGHTDLVYMENHNTIKWVGGTRDDAAGEAFDKTARLLGLSYPGGPEISKAADRYFNSKPTDSKTLQLFPRPMIHSNNFDWSFSGLKTSVLNYTKTHDNLNTDLLSAEIQEAIVDVLVTKSLRAIKEYNPKSFILSGGVAANNKLRQSFVQQLYISKMKTKFHVSHSRYCTDNAASIAAVAFINQRIVHYKNIKATPNLSITD